MSLYELLYIVGTQYTEAEVDGIRNLVVQMIEKEGGKVSRHENLGKLKLAYPIKGMRHGTYVVAHVEAETAAVGAIERNLRLSDEVLRHQIISIPESARKRAYTITSYVAPLSEEARAVKREDKPTTYVPTATRAVPEIAPPVPAKTDETSPSMSMEELDQKLDKILEGDVTDNV